MEILPAIDLRGGQCVRLRQGDYAQETVFSNDPAEMARKWEAEGAARLHLVDLDGAKAGHPVNGAAIQKIVAAVKIPCELGGGIRDDNSLSTVLKDWGIDRAIVGTQALKHPEWFRAAVRRYPDHVALGLDARDGFVATAGWLDVSKTSAFDLAKQFSGLPLAAVIYTNIANDGMMQGIDAGTLVDLEALAEHGFPVIASGGVTSVNDVRHLATIHKRQPNLIGAIIGRALYEGSLTVRDAIAAAK